MKRFLIITILITILAPLFGYAPKARAGLVIKLPSSLGLATNLQGHWTFDSQDVSWGEGNAFDKTSNNNHGSFAGGLATTTAPVAGKIGQGLKFDGVNDLVNAGTAASLDNLSAITISTWIFPKSVAAATAEVVNKRPASGGNLGWKFGPSSSGAGRLSFVVDYSPTPLNHASVSDVIKQNTWQHIVATWDGSDQAANARIYINGVETTYAVTTNGSTSRVDDDSGFVAIGARPDGANPFNGSIDDVRIYNRVLSAAEILRLYNMGGTLKVGKTDTTTLTTGLQGHWTFDSQDVSWGEGNVFDKTSNNNTGSLNGQMSTTTAPVAGKIGQGLKFDGVNDTISMGNVLNLTGAVSVSLWAKFPTGLDNASDVFIGRFGGDHNAGQEQYSLMVHNSVTTVKFNISNGSALLTSNTPAGTIKPNTWYHMAGVYNGTDTTSLYINGQVSDSDTSASFGSLNSPGGVTFGIFRGNFPPGIADDVRIYNRALSAAEIKRLYNMGGTLKVGKTDTTTLTTGLQGHWTFDSQDVSWGEGNAFDKTSNNNHGSFAGAMATTTAPVAGKIGQGLKFDGSNDAVNAASASSLDDIPSQGNGGMTVAFWLKPGTDIDSVLVGKDNGANGGGGWRITQNGAGNSKRITFIKEGTTDSSTVFNSALTRGVWQHVVFTWNGSMTFSTGLNLYINGTLYSVRSDTDGSGANSDASRILCMGALSSDDISCNSDFADESLDDVRLYNRILSAAEIQRLYQMGR